MSDSVAGKKIWIVGASVGIGEALAHLLATEGAHLFLSARSQDKLETLTRALSGSGHTSVPMNVTDSVSIQKAWDTIHRASPIDLVIYNAGYYEPLSGSAFDLAKSEAMLDVNFHGALRVLAHVLPYFVERRKGHLVLVGSVAGYCGLPNSIGYGASKAALIHLAEDLALDLTKHQIKVQVVNPGFVDTRLTQKNSFKMPFLMKPEAAAERILKGLKAGSFDINFPKRLSLALKLLRCLPYPLYFKLLKNL